MIATDPAAYGTQEGGDCRVTCVTCGEVWPCPTAAPILALEGETND